MISTITLLPQVGFDAGDGVNFFAIPESQTADVVNVVSSSNIGINGMRLYKLSDAQISRYIQHKILLIMRPNIVLYALSAI